jgi:hypothetical protein
MIGLIFTSLADMVEEQYGLVTWNEIVREAGIPDCGAYTQGQSYPDAQMVKLIEVMHRRLNLPVDVLLRSFGEYVFSYLANAFPEVSGYFNNAKEMLMHVDDYIHKEIAFCHPQGVGLPTFECIDKGGNQVTMLYRSPRKLCFLAEGVIHGVGKHFGCRIDMSHTTCVHRGDECCTFEVVVHDQ